MRTRRRAHAALAALSIALLFFAGNLYYSYYMLFVVALLAVSMVLTVRRGEAFLRLQWERLAVIAVVCVLALGLVAVQLLPMAEFLPHFGKATDPQLTESHTLEQIWRDFTSPALPRPDAMLYTALQPEEYYAYIGLLPFVAILLLPLAVTRQSRRTILFFALLFGFALLWIDIRDTPLRELYTRSTALQQFRYPTRFLIYGGFAVLGARGPRPGCAVAAMRRQPRNRARGRAPKLARGRAGRGARYSRRRTALVAGRRVGPEPTGDGDPRLRQYGVRHRGWLAGEELAPTTT